MFCTLRDTESSTILIDVTTDRPRYITSPGCTAPRVRPLSTLAASHLRQERQRARHIDARIMDPSPSEYPQNASRRRSNSAPASISLERRQSRQGRRARWGGLDGQSSSRPQRGFTLRPTPVRLTRAPSPRLSQSILQPILRPTPIRPSRIPVPTSRRRTAANRFARSHSSDSVPATASQPRKYSTVQFCKSARRGRRVLRHLLNTIDSPQWTEHRMEAHSYTLPRPYRRMNPRMFQSLTRLYCGWNRMFQIFLKFRSQKERRERVPIIQPRGEGCRNQRSRKQLIEALEQIPSSDESEPELFTLMNEESSTSGVSSDSRD